MSGISVRKLRIKAMQGTSCRHDCKSAFKPELTEQVGMDEQALFHTFVRISVPLLPLLLAESSRQELRDQQCLRAISRLCFL